jgi:hypothetical protein
MYLKSDVVKAVFGDEGGDKLLDFIRGFIIPHEQSFCFYLRKGVRHFETTTNSGHEGTNHAIKSGPSRVLPQHGIDKSAKIQADKDCTKFDLYHRQWASTFVAKATWSTSSTVNHLTLPAEFMLNTALFQCESYASWRVANDKWLVVRSVEREVRSLIPRFKRVYTVTLHTFEHASCLMCDCKYFECNGMVCHHLAHVKTYYAAKSDITHHDVSHRWWKAHLYFSMRNGHNDCTPEERQVRIELESIRQNECKGPSFAEKPDVHILSPFSRVYQFGKHSNDVFRNATKHSLTSLFKKDSITHRVINYSADEVIVAIKHSSTNVPLAMSQEAHLQNGFSDDGSDIDGSDDDYNNGCLIESPVRSDCIYLVHVFTRT